MVAAVGRVGVGILDGEVDGEVKGEETRLNARDMLGESFVVLMMLRLVAELPQGAGAARYV